MPSNSNFKYSHSHHREWLYFSLALLIVFVISFFIRIWHVGYAEPWSDEIHSILYSRNTVLHLIDLKRTSDLHPPLYFLSLKAWFTVFGETRESARFFSVVTGTFCVPLVFAIGRDMFGARVGLMAAIFFSTAPLAVHYAREIRMYSLFTFLFLISLLAFLHFIREAKRQVLHKASAAAYGGCFSVFLALTFYTHYTSILLYILFSLFSFTYLLGKKFKVFTSIIIVLFFAVLLALPQTFHLFRNSIGHPFKAWMPPTTLETFYSISLGAYPYYFLIKLFVFISLVAGLVAIWIKNRESATLLFLFTAGGMLIAAAIGVFEPIYLVRTIQVFTVLSSIILAYLAKSLPRGVQVFFIVSIIAANLNTVVEREYLPKRQQLFIEAANELTYIIEPSIDQVFFKSYLQPQAELHRSNLFSNARSIELVESDEKMHSVEEAVDRCLILNTNHISASKCRAVLLIVEQDALFEKESSMKWNNLVDNLEYRFPNHVDRTLSAFRIAIFSNDSSFLQQAAQTLDSKVDKGRQLN